MSLDEFIEFIEDTLRKQGLINGTYKYRNAGKTTSALIKAAVWTDNHEQLDVFSINIVKGG